MDQSRILLLEACQGVKKVVKKKERKNDGRSERAIAKDAQIS